ncbi:hypothetical protein PVA19_10545 [Agrobacterium sp. CNPSo 3708]|uniref:hypothetical protein n=1 Tax=Agrobacterium sp. CNPSo 3708 TaxID=3028150 RepID=UPI00236483EA|nr:hypothetical protein [Agrobacterium sp. CNPSo 3708]MDD1498849.1 hypothetical protein [Agrobacterium sp. CNPSo 3708]
MIDRSNKYSNRRLDALCFVPYLFRHDQISSTTSTTLTFRRGTGGHCMFVVEMTMKPTDLAGLRLRTDGSGPVERFRPFGTVRCTNTPYFKSQLARDQACLLDLDDDVVAWCCRPTGMDILLLQRGWRGEVPDFMASYANGQDVYISVREERGDPELTEIAACGRFTHTYASRAQINSGYRLQNAKDLLRYARYRCPLGDRMRILSALEHEGSATVAECLDAFKEINPMAGLSSLILHRFVALELDVEPIAPTTTVSIFRSGCNA